MIYSGVYMCLALYICVLITPVRRHPNIFTSCKSFILTFLYNYYIFTFIFLHPTIH